MSSHFYRPFHILTTDLLSIHLAEISFQSLAPPMPQTQIFYLPNSRTEDGPKNFILPVFMAEVAKTTTVRRHSHADHHTCKYLPSFEMPIFAPLSFARDLFHRLRRSRAGTVWNSNSCEKQEWIEPARLPCEQIKLDITSAWLDMGIKGEIGKLIAKGPILVYAYMQCLTLGTINSNNFCPTSPHFLKPLFAWPSCHGNSGSLMEQCNIRWTRQPCCPRIHESAGIGRGPFHICFLESLQARQIRTVRVRQHTQDKSAACPNFASLECLMQLSNSRAPQSLFHSARQLMHSSHPFPNLHAAAKQ